MATVAPPVTPHADMVAFLREHGGIVGTLEYVFGAAQQIGGRDARLACVLRGWIVERRAHFEDMLPPEILEEFLISVRNIRHPEY
jgi:hypothetical protein